MKRCTIVTVAPPTPNGDLHLGHVSGPYLGADVYLRSHLSAHQEGIYLVGTDPHQSYMTVKALELGVETAAAAAHFEASIAEVFQKIGLSNARLLQPLESPRFSEVVQDFFRTLYDKGKLLDQDMPSAFCTGCNLHLVDAYLTGTCPRCGNDDCDGNLCESCAWPNSCTDLIDARCLHCGSTPSLSTLRRLVFPLSEYTTFLRKYLSGVIMSDQLRDLFNQMLTEGLPDIAITQPEPWGVTCNIPGYTHQRYFVWAAMGPGYLAALDNHLNEESNSKEDWKTVWNEAKITQFFGWDNSYFHGLLIPALMHAADENLHLPDAFYVNEFLNLDGEKFSTSREHAIWANAFLSEYPADVCRYVLARNRPEFYRTSFTLEAFAAIANSELHAGIGGYCHAALERLRDHGTILQGSSQRSFEEISPTLREIVGLARASYSDAQFSVARVTRALHELAQRAHELHRSRDRLFSGDSNSVLMSKSLLNDLFALHEISVLSNPIMPEFAKKLWKDLGQSGCSPAGEYSLTTFYEVTVPTAPYFPFIAIDTEHRSSGQAT